MIDTTHDMFGDAAHAPEPIIVQRRTDELKPGESVVLLPTGDAVTVAAITPTAWIGTKGDPILSITYVDPPAGWSEGNTTTARSMWDTLDYTPEG